MAGNYAQLLDIINNPTNHSLPAWDNNNKLIDGLTVKQYLLTIIQSLTAGYQFMGVATPSTSPGTPDQNVFYIGGAGTYNGFGTNIIVNDGCLGIFIWNGSWNGFQIKITDKITVSNNIDTGAKAKSIQIGSVVTMFEDAEARKSIQDIINATCDVVTQKTETSITPEMSNGYINTNGEESTSSDYKKTEKIAVKEGDKLTVQNAINVSFWAYFSGETFIQGYQYSLSRIIPAGVNWVIISFSNEYITGTVTVQKQSEEITSMTNNTKEDVERIIGATCNEKYDWVNHPFTPKIFNGYVDNNGNTSTSSSYRKTEKIAVKSGDKVSATGVINARWWAFYNGDNFVSGAEYGLQKTIPNGVDGVIISFDNEYIQSTVGVNVERYEVVETTNNALEKKCGLNVLNPSTVTEGKYLKPDGDIGSGDYTLTDYIEVSEGNELLCGVDGQTNDVTQHIAFRFVAAYDNNKELITASGQSSQKIRYVVPSGVAYVRCTLNVATLPQNCMLQIHGERIPYVPYEETITPVGGHKIEYDIWHRKNSFLTDIPNYALKTMAYKPLGQLNEAYVCLTTDDGLPMLATYTIPMCIEKGVPLTMSLWATSEVLVDTTMRATVLDAVENHGFVVSRHGMSPWIGYSEPQLKLIFDTLDSQFAEMGITAIGACPPFGQVSPLLCAYCGGRFGVVRSLYSGVGPERDGLTIHGSRFVNTGKSNMYALSSVSIADWDLDGHKASVDLAIANGGIVMKHWHDNNDDLSTANKAKLEAFIDYCLAQNVKFITLADIPYLPFTKEQWEQN